jgi:hypothetical protein
MEPIPAPEPGLAVLQRAADHAVVRRSLRATGTAATVFGLLGLLFGVAPPADPPLITIASALTIVGLWNLTNPSPIGIALAGGCLVLVGGFNIVGTLGGDPNMTATGFWVAVGIAQIAWGLRSFGRFRRFARSFDALPDHDELKRAERIVSELRRAHARYHPDMIELQTGGFPPRVVRVRMMDGAAVCLIDGERDVRVVRPQQFDLHVIGRSRFSSDQRVQAFIGGQALRGRVSQEAIDRHAAWRSAEATPETPVRLAA